MRIRTGPITRASAAFLLGYCCLSGPLRSEEHPLTVEFGFEEVPSPLFVPAGSVETVEVLATIQILDDPELDGIRGWAIGIGVEGARISGGDVTGLTIVGRDGLVPIADSFFVVTEVGVQDEGDDERPGFVSMVVGVSYPADQGYHEAFPYTRTPVLRLHLEAKAPTDECRPIRVWYEDGFHAAAGDGPPVENSVTWQDKIVRPLTGDLEFCLYGRESTFRRGDANEDGDIDVSDGITILDYLFRGGVSTYCEKSFDVNDNGKLSISDSIRLFQFLFLGADPLPAPFMRCGSDETEDGLACGRNLPCGS